MPQKTTSSLNSSKYSIETMATGGTTTVAVTTTTTTKLATADIFDNCSPSLALPRFYDTYWQQQPANSSYRSATVSRRAFIVPHTPTPLIASFQKNNNNILNSRSVNNIFDSIKQQQRHLFLQQQPEKIIQQQQEQKRCSSTLMRYIFVKKKIAFFITNSI